MSKRKPPFIQIKQSKDWCHVCGKSKFNNIELQTEDDNFTRICANCVITLAREYPATAIKLITQGKKSNV